MDYRIECEVLFRLLINNKDNIDEVVKLLQAKYSNKCKYIELQLNQIKLYLNDSNICGYVDSVYKNVTNFINEESFIGLGAGRAVFGLNDDYVLKLHLNNIGFNQSIQELSIYEKTNNTIKERLSKPIIVLKEFSIYERCNPSAHLVDDEDIKDFYSKNECVQINKLISYLEKEYSLSPYDLESVNNIGRNKSGEWIILDYGMTDSELKYVNEGYGYRQDEFYSILDDVKDKKINWNTYKKYIISCFDNCYSDIF